MTEISEKVMITPKERLIELLNARAEDRSIALKDKYAEFGRLIQHKAESQQINDIGNKCRLLEGEQNAYEECIDLVMNEL